MDQQGQDQQGQSRSGPTRWQLLWTGGIVASLTVAILIGYRYDITLWDWIKLLIVPAVIAGGGLWFNVQQREREQLIADNRAQDDNLQAYLDGMSQLLTDKDRPLHSAQPGDSLSTVARARTTTVLGRLDGSRKRSVLEFLYESRLIEQEQALLDESGLIERHHSIISLHHADLIEAALIVVNLRGVNLRGAILSRADLRRADLSRADLSWSILIGADLRDANLSEINLSWANLREANLSWANLNNANLSGAELSNVYLNRAEMSEAVGLTDEQIAVAKSLEGATMPNGQKYEDWLKSIKSKDRGKDGENSGTS